MKSIRQAAIVFFILMGMVLGIGCHKTENAGGEPPKAAEVSATKNSFQAVASKLDAGGNLYLYLSTEEWLEGLSGKISGWREIADAIPDVKAEDRNNINKVFEVVTDLIKKSGVEEVSGVGMSSIEREKGLYHSTFIVHHYPGQGTGFLWTMFGKSPHSLNGLDILPASTVVATFKDLDLGMLWSVLGQEISSTGIPEVKDAMQKLPDQFAAATGMQLDKVLASLGNEYGLVVTLDDAKKISIPLVNPPMEVPEPGVMLVIKVKDDTIFNRVDEALKDNKMVVRADKEGVKMRTVPVPLPLPISLRPTIARSGDYLFVATSDTLIEEALAVKSAKKPGLKSSEELKRLSKGIPTEGNSFAFVSARFTRTLKDVQTQVMAGKSAGKPGQVEFMKKLVNLNEAAFSYAVSANTDEGWVATGNGNQNPAKLVLLPAVVVPAVAAGMVLPALAKAKDRAQTVACINNLRQIDLAKKQWSSENKKTADDVPTWADLKPYLGDTDKLTCPSGGTYNLNPVSEPPTCSHSGHTLKK